MRVTNKMLADSLTADLSRTQDKLIKTYNQLSSGKKVSRPSQAPVDAKNILNYKKVISRFGQYKRNAQFAEHYLTNGETSLSAASNILSRLREISVSQSSDTFNADTRDGASVEVDGLFKQLLAISNSKVEGRYTFSGFKTDTQPFDSSGAYSGDSNEATLKIDDSTTLKYGLSGDKVFKGSGISGGIDILQKVQDMKSSLSSNDASGIRNAIDDMDKSITQIENTRADVGARLNRLSSQKGMLDDFETETRTILSGMEDADIVQVSTELSRRQVAMQALFSATNTILNLNIFNFIR